MIAIVDTGGANLRSVANALSRLGADSELTTDPERIRRADRVLLPGVGAAGEAMARLNAAELVEVIRSLTQPVLGICLGMQLLFTSSEEGDGGRRNGGTTTLGLLPGRVTAMAAAPGKRVPHLGWNSLELPLAAANRPQPLLTGLAAGSAFYFVHSFQAPMGPWVLAVTDHFGPVPAVVAQGNFYGVQFHPEKSQAAGAKLLENFLNL